MEKLLRKIVAQLHEDGKAFEALEEDPCRLPSLGGFTVLPEVINERRKDLIIEIDKFIRYAITDERSQKMQIVPVDRMLLIKLVNYLTEENGPVNIAICATPTSPAREKLSIINMRRMQLAAQLRKLLKTDKVAEEDFIKVKDIEQKLPFEKRLRLSKLLRERLIDLLGSTDTQVDCYELIYDEFFTKEDGDKDVTICETYEKLVSSYLDTQWEMWREELTKVIQRKVADDVEDES